MIEMEQKTCTLKIFAKKNIGQIFFLNGALIDSETVRLKHLDALLDILSWDNIVIEVQKNIFKKQNVINLPLMHILIEGAQHADEIKKITLQDSAKNISIPIKKNIIRPILKNEYFCLEIGIKLLIDSDAMAVSFRSALVGMEHGKYLLLKAPGQLSKMDHDTFQTEDLIIKSLYKGTIYAFRSKLISIIYKPSNLIFIEYPQRIEHHELRSHKRFKCNFVAHTEINKKDRSAVIENISIGGCLCTVETCLTENNLLQSLKKNDAIPFRCHFPGSLGEVSFKGEIRNTQKKSNELVVGIKFIYPENTNKIENKIKTYIQLIECSGENV